MANELTKIPKFRRCVLQNFPFIEQDFDALTDYELLCKVVEYLNKVITSQNEVIEVAESLTAAFNQLQSFVENYFENLDVQEEINNKLDQMVEDGTLQEIITTYIQSNVVWTFDTVADMKESTNLIAGSYAQTLGFYTINDGGGAIYKITNTGIANEMDVIAVGDLYANLVAQSTMTPEQFGASGDGVTDDSNFIEEAIKYCESKNIPLILNNSYNLTREITFTNMNNVSIIGNNAKLIVNTIVPFYFSKINKLLIKGLKVEGTLSSGNPVAGLVHTLEGKDIDVNHIDAKQLGYVLKTDTVLTNDETQFIADRVNFTDITGEDCEILLLNNFTKELYVENIINYSPNDKTRELFYLQGGIVNSYFRNIYADKLVRWAFHFNVSISGGGTLYDFNVEHNKNKNCYIDNIVVCTAQCLLHFTSYCENVYVNNAKCENPIYNSVNNYTCENVYVSNSTIKMIDGSAAGTVNYAKFTNCNILNNSSSAVNTVIELDNCNWSTNITDNIFFMYMLAGTLIIKNSTLTNTSSTSQQCLQSNNGATISLYNNKVNVNKANRLVAIINASDHVTILNNVIDAETSIGGIYTGSGTPYISAGNYIDGVLQS